MAKTIIRSAIRILLARVCLALLVLPCAAVARAQAPDCIECHEAKNFAGKVVHAPVASGPCTTCHDPHLSQDSTPAPKPTIALCLDCHADVKNKPHVISGFARGGHPLGDESRTVQDPLRPGKAFSCASCHEPHRADFARLTRFDSRSTTGFCQACHKI